MRSLAVAAVLALFVAGCGSVERNETAEPPTTEAAMTEPSITDTAAADALPDLGPAPELVELDGWLQTDIDSLEDLRGKVVVIQFWTFGCHNCKATLPTLQALYAAHHGEDFEIVGIHSPEFSYEEVPDAIAAAADQLGVTWPIALDTAKRTFFHWQGSPAYWPRTYVLDRGGHIRFDHIGEGAYDELNQAVDALLG
jgi:thiol-disulfide isomerase/thioredoxin